MIIPKANNNAINVHDTEVMFWGLHKHLVQTSTIVEPLDAQQTSQMNCSAELEAPSRRTASRNKKAADGKRQDISHLYNFQNTFQTIVSESQRYDL